MNVVLSSYLVEKPDPQALLVPSRPKYWPRDDGSIVVTWIESLRRLRLNGVIFHDQLSPEFVARWSDDLVQFVPIEWSTPWNSTEERFYVYREWLTVHDEVDVAMATDLSDVEFYSDPFDVMLDPRMLYVGIETWRPTARNCVGRWMTAAFGEVTDCDKMILNPGILGGRRLPLVDFLGRLIDEMRGGKPGSVGLDLVAFNRLIYREQIPFVTGPPLHSKFMSYQPPSCGAAIRHK